MQNCLPYFFFLMLYNPSVGILQFCSFLERIPVGKRQCVQNMTFIQAKEFVFFSSFALYIPSPLHQWPSVFSWQWVITSSMLHETSYFGSWPTWALVSDSSIFFGQVFIFLGFLCTSKVVLFKTH